MPAPTDPATPRTADRPPGERHDRRTGSDGHRTDSGDQRGDSDDRQTDSARDSARDPGIEPDPRYTFANERTYLAWNRTALALIVGGLAVAQFLDVGVAGLQLIVAIPLIALGLYLALGSYRHWQSNERALRLAKPLPSADLPRVLQYGVAIFAVAAIALAVLHFTT